MSKKAKAQEHKQKEYQQKVSNKAKQTLNQLVSQFYEVFIANDPNSDEVATMLKQVSVKWKMTCQQLNLKSEVYSLCEDECKAIINQFNDEMKPPVMEVVPDKKEGRFASLFNWFMRKKAA